MAPPTRMPHPDAPSPPRDQSRAHVARAVDKARLETAAAPPGQTPRYLTPPPPLYSRQLPPTVLPPPSPKDPTSNRTCRRGHGRLRHLHPSRLLRRLGLRVGVGAPQGRHDHRQGDACGAVTRVHQGQETGTRETKGRPHAMRERPVSSQRLRPHGPSRTSSPTEHHDPASGASSADPCRDSIAPAVRRHAPGHWRLSPSKRAVRARLASRRAMSPRHGHAKSKKIVRGDTGDLSRKRAVPTTTVSSVGQRPPRSGGAIDATPANRASAHWHPQSARKKERWRGT